MLAARRGAARRGKEMLSIQQTAQAHALLSLNAGTQQRFPTAACQLK
jgi:hypothetical protein